MSDTSHIDETGAARMVDVSAKPLTRRVARAGGTLRMSARAFDAIVSGELAKGDALAVARVAGIHRRRRKVSQFASTCRRPTRRSSACRACRRRP